jgi:hypothetical protein
MIRARVHDPSTDLREVGTLQEALLSDDDAIF